MEDADPVAVAVAELGVRALDAVDRVIGFRAAHAAHTAVPQGRSAPLPPIAGTPYAGELDIATLPTRTRARLRQRYRRWEDEVRRARATPRHSRDPSGGYDGWTADELNALTVLFEVWQAELAQARQLARSPAEDASASAR